MPRAFISYSHDDAAHREWVRDLASRLRADGVETVLDQWHLIPGDQIPAFMETSVRESDFVLIICTPRYRERSDARTGGAGYEGDIMTGEVMTGRSDRKFIPILRRGAWKDAAPSWLKPKYHLDLRDEADHALAYKDLLDTLLGTRAQAPPVGRPAAAPPAAAAELAAADEPLRITGLVVNEVGTPREDGTRGSALYRVPFRLSRRPPPGWDRLFIEAWNHPMSFSTMHRPGIATVIGERIILDGTSVEEVKKYHRPTLVEAVNRANAAYAEMERRQRDADTRERERLERHRKSVADAADDLKFE